MSKVPTHEEIDSRLALDDHSGALELARRRLDDEPDDARAAGVVARSTAVLTQMYLGRLGGARRRVRLAMPRERLLWNSMDHRAGFLVSIAEEPTTIEELLEICGMPALEALAVLVDLVDRNVLRLEGA
ncbi:MAG: hypothetical protein IT373_19195 [Polyangiaceae bacterium]|nr:hypothetical protein [Polyangiaceae bacterium]